MKIFRVFLKEHNGHYIDFPCSEDEGAIQNVLGFWKMEGTLYRTDPMFGVPAAVPFSSWSFACVLNAEGPTKPGTSFDFLHPKPN